MVIFGWLRRATVLGMKLDECASCHRVGTHILVRKTWWGHVFWMPLLFLRFEHGMACEECGAWTGIPFLVVRRAMKARRLALERPRPGFAATREEIWAETGKRPSEAELFEPVVVNPKRGIWDLWLKAWPILAAVVPAIVVAFPRQTSAALGDPQAKYGPAHTCWEASDGSINGCRLLDGRIDGLGGTRTSAR